VLREIPLVASGADGGELLALADLAERQAIRLVVTDSPEAWTVASRLAEVGASVIQNVRSTWGKPRGDRRTQLGGGARADAATLLARAGVAVAIVTPSDTIELWGVAGRDLLNLPMEAAFAQREGLTAQEALEAITIVPARLYGADGRIGSLEPGKDADVIVTDGDLLDYRTLVRTTIVNGRIAYQAEGNRFWRGIVSRRDRALRDGSAEAPEPEKGSGPVSISPLPPRDVP
jgi:imidazolonepropionase-like amidohydrolase